MEGAAPLPAHEDMLGHQVVGGMAQRADGHAERGRQRGLARQRSAGLALPPLDLAQECALDLPVHQGGVRRGDDRDKDGDSGSFHGAHIVALGAAVIHGRGARHARHPSHMNDWFDTGKYADRHCPIATFAPQEIDPWFTSFCTTPGTRWPSWWSRASRPAWRSTAGSWMRTARP